MCRAEECCTDALALLGMCMAFKEDMQASVTMLVYGEPLRIPVKILAASDTTGHSLELMTQVAAIWKSCDRFPRRGTRPRLSSSSSIWRTLPQSSSGRMPPGPALQRAIQGPEPREEDVAHRHEGQICHSVKQEVYGRLRHAGDRRTHLDQSGSPRAHNATRTTGRPSSHADHPLRPTRPLPGVVKLGSTIFREGMMWGHPTNLSTALLGASWATTQL